MKMVYLSPVPWLSISQRPHYFVQEALKQKFNEVLWVDPYPGRLPGLQDFIPGRHTAEPTGITALAGLQVLNTGVIIPIEPFGLFFDVVNYLSLSKTLQRIIDFIDCDDCILVFGKPSRLALSLIKKLRWNTIWFDAMDNYPAFYNSLSKIRMQQLENEVVSYSNKLTCSSYRLAEKFSKNNSVLVIQNATAPYIESIREGKPANDGFLYIGTIASWIDWTWIIKLANENKSKIIAMYGPIKTRVPALPNNVVLFDPIPHGNVKELLESYSTAIIPFKDNEITKYVDPVKFYEYQAAGLDIISTIFGEMNWHFEMCKSLGQQCDIDEANNCIYFHNSGDAIIHTWSTRLKGVFNEI